MKINPWYSYEYNVVLNTGVLETDDEQIKNFASLLSDKDRFLEYLPLIEKNSKLIEERLGFKLKKEYDFYVVRAEKFKSFSDPITIEYSVLPEEMIIFLIKEIVKMTIEGRFLDDVSKEQYVNVFVEYILVNGNFEKESKEGKSLGGSLSETFVKFGKNLHDESKRLDDSYEFKEMDFSKLTMADHMEKMYSEMHK